jgi:2-hydroxy-6-oxonona-2,4-dienedioate hydrolase
MKRRQFLRYSGLLGGSALLSACGENDSLNLERDISPVTEWMDRGPLKSVFTEVNGLRMHALSSADSAPPGASPIVLVHGSGLSHAYMIPTARELTPYFAVYVPDIPGYGDSDDPGLVLDIPGMAIWLSEWMEAIGLPRAAFLGNSFGCQVIAHLAAYHPERVTHAILQGPTTPPDERSAFWQFIRWRQNAPFNPEYTGQVSDPAYVKAGPWRLIRSYVFQVTDRIEDKVGMIQAPTLVIRGELDPISHQRFCEQLVALLPHGELEIIPEVAHTLVFTAPTRLAEATQRFVTREGKP